MPEPASSRSLEDILASIRRSLSEESVNGLVELSSAAVDAARAEQGRASVTAQELAPVADAAAPRSAADALADELLREKLAGALVLDPDAGEAEFSEADAAADDDPGEASAANVSSQDAELDSEALAKLWVLRPGIEQAKPAPASAAQGLSLDPFAGVSDAGSRESQPAPEFNLSPLELLGGAQPLANPLAKPLASMPPLPAAQEAANPAEPARADGSVPPRLDPASVALLRKLRASNAVAIDNIAKSVAESAELTEPAVDVTEPPVAAPADAVLDLVTAAPEADAQEAMAPAVASADVPPFVAAEPEARPVLSMPERSTPLFGGHEDARPPLTSGLDHLLPEGGAVALTVEEDVVPEVNVPEPAIEAAEASVPAAPAEQVLEPEVQVQVEDSEPVPVDVALDPAPLQPTAEAAAEAPQVAAPGDTKALEDMIAAVLEPVLQRLIETSIGPALEALVRREVERVLKEQRPPE